MTYELTLYTQSVKLGPRGTKIKGPVERTVQHITAVCNTEAQIEAARIAKEAKAVQYNVCRA